MYPQASGFKDIETFSKQADQTRELCIMDNALGIIKNCIQRCGKCDIIPCVRSLV